MPEKGMILEIHEQYAIALKPGGAMVKIKRKEGLQVGDRIYILPEDYYIDSADKAVVPMQNRERRTRYWLPQFAGIAAAAFLIIALVLNPASQTVYAVASFDGDQDIQLELDREFCILNGYSYGNEISEEEIQRLKGSKLNEVGEELTSLMGDGPVLIGYASNQENAEKDAETERTMRNMFSDHITLYLSGNEEDIELAKSTQISLGFHLAGEVVDENSRNVLDQFLETYDDYQDRQEELSESDGEESEEKDFFCFSGMSLDEIMKEIHGNPLYEGNDEVLEWIADKVEDLHEDYKKKEWDDDDDVDSDEDDEDNDDDDDDDDDDEDKSNEEKIKKKEQKEEHKDRDDDRRSDHDDSDDDDDKDDD